MKPKHMACQEKKTELRNALVISFHMIHVTMYGFISYDSLHLCLVPETLKAKCLSKKIDSKKKKKRRKEKG